jgi:hypothetical protein
VDQPWTELLKAIAAGDEVLTRARAVKLAAELITSPIVVLAQQVLAGGPHATARAIELAERLCEHAGQVEGSGVAKSTGSGVPKRESLAP